jgi:3-phenylpropionate/cinnamic acid dioxygenase small subunit
MPVASVREEVEELYAAYVECLDDGELERWPELFTDDCLYKIIPRENYERGLPLALMLCESKGMLLDRVAAVRRTSVYAPRVLRHLVSSIRVIPHADTALRGRANYVVLETPLNEETHVLGAGEYLDQLVHEAGALKFKERLCILDSTIVPGSLIYPI